MLAGLVHQSSMKLSLAGTYFGGLERNGNQPIPLIIIIELEHLSLKHNRLSIRVIGLSWKNLETEGASCAGQVDKIC